MLLYDPDKGVNINNLSNHEFLVKNIKESIELKNNSNICKNLTNELLSIIKENSVIELMFSNKNLNDIFNDEIKENQKESGFIEPKLIPCLSGFNFE